MRVFDKVHCVFCKLEYLYMRGHLRQYSVANSVMKIKFFANKTATEIEQTE